MSSKIDIQRIGEKSFSLDVRGYVCPYPELLTLKTLKTLSSGDVLEVLLDNPPSVRDIPITIKKRGYTISDISRINRGLWKIIVEIS
jgi:tRNA 2-thiouridine synthesizing protein A